MLTAKILSLYDALFRDIVYRWPEMAEDVRRDRIRFARMCQARGNQFLLVDLPKLGKHLDRCLDMGTYTKSSLPASKPVGGRFGEIPVLFRGLYLRVFDAIETYASETGKSSIVLSVKQESDFDHDALFFLRQLLCCAKKASVPCPAKRVDEAFEAFDQCEAELPDVEPWWDDDLPDEERQQLLMPTQAFASSPLFVERADQRGTTRELLSLLDRVSSLVSKALGDFDPQDWRFKHGNGAKSNIKSGEDRYTFPTWSLMLDTVFPYADCAFHAHNAWADATWIGPLDSFREFTNEEFELEGYLTPSSRLITVPKTYSAPRLIAPEPVENAWAQQCLLDFFYSKSERSWLESFVRFHDQTLSQELCRIGSKDRSLATIDLSEASDRVTPLVVSCTFKRASVLYALRACRTRLIQTPTKGLWKLKKFSTMGSACTFPVESLVFLCAALTGALHSLGISNPSLEDINGLKGKISVFGDDIVVPTESYDVVCTLLEILFFKVNLNKSFAGPGGFRESCGVDCFRGIEVTPAYYKGYSDETSEAVVSMVEQSNNFYKKFLVNASEAIREQLKGLRMRLPFVPLRSKILGFASFVRPPCLLKVRRNAGLQRVEMLAPFLSGRCNVVRLTGDRNLHQYFTERPSPLEEWKAGVREPGEAILRKTWFPTTDWDPAE